MIRFLLILIVPILFIFFLATGAFAQENPEQLAAKYGITFPIGELGNCANYQECRSYCEDPVNAEKCIAFAKQKGFYRQETLNSQEEAVLASAQSELGCNSIESCKSYCESEANFEKCHSFAQKHSLSGGYRDNPHEQKFIEKAKEELGCDSAASCMSFCQDQANFSKCTEFAKKVGLSGGHETKGPGGCTSDETCQSYCSDPANFETCSKYSSQGGHQFNGPGGCNNEESCRTYCQAHPGECGYHQDNTTNYQDYESFCRQNPDKCAAAPTPAGSQTDYCKQYPEKCNYSTPTTYTNPEDYCKQYPDRCNQTQTQTQSSPAPVTTESQQTNSESSYQQPTDPSSECQKAGGSWTGSTCQFQQVQGASSKGNFLMQVLQGLLDLF